MKDKLRRRCHAAILRAYADKIENGTARCGRDDTTVAIGPSSIYNTGTA